MSNRLLRVHPSELKIPYEVKRKRSCCITKTNQYVAFKLKTTNPRKYSVRHACGILLPGSSCDITVIMQAPHEVLSDFHCKDKFLVQSVVVGHGATMRDFAPELFTKAPGRVIEEFKLRVVYVAANPPSPVPEEEEEEDTSPRSEAMSYEVKISSVFDAVSTRTDTSEKKVSSAEESGTLHAQGEGRRAAHTRGGKDRQVHFLTSRDISIQGASVESMLVTEREYPVEENQKLQQQMELLRAARTSQQGFSVMFVLLVFMSSVCIGHFMKHIKV